MKKHKTVDILIVSKIKTFNQECHKLRANGYMPNTNLTSVRKLTGLYLVQQWSKTTEIV